MFKKCKHEWEIVLRRFTPPCDLDFKLTGANSHNTFLQMTQGFTTIEERCVKCNKTIFSNVVGNQT